MTIEIVKNYLMIKIFSITPICIFYSITGMNTSGSSSFSASDRTTEDQSVLGVPQRHAAQTLPGRLV